MRSGAGTLLYGEYDPSKGIEELSVTDVHVERSGLGLRPFAFRIGEAMVLGYGDALHAEEERLASDDIDDVLDWCQRQFLRFAAVVCAGSVVTFISDHMGMCPLNFCFVNRSVRFSNSARAISTVEGAERIREFLEGKPLPEAGTTVFSGVKAAPPGSITSWVWDNGEWSQTGHRRYFSLPERTTISDPSLAIEAIRNALPMAVRTMTKGINEVCVSLSGGVDSTSVACLAAQAGVRLNTYTMGTNFGDEFREAGETARILGSNHHELRMSANDLLELLPGLLRSYEVWDPLTLQIAAPAAFIYRSVSSESTVFLTGYGADLVFAGTLPTQWSEDALNAAIRVQVEDTRRTNEFSPVSQAMYNVTVRYPFWSPDLLQAALQISAPLKVQEGIEKWILRKAMEPYIPAAVAWRRKIGIHEGSAMHSLFSQALGTSDYFEQSRILREMAVSEFGKN